MVIYGNLWYGMVTDKIRFPRRPHFTSSYFIFTFNGLHFALPEDHLSGPSLRTTQNYNVLAHKTQVALLGAPARTLQRGCMVLRLPGAAARRQVPGQEGGQEPRSMVYVASQLSPSNLTRVNNLVYTCQKPQSHRCTFFLWKEEAEPREQAVVLSNSRSEDELRYPTLPTPSTPSKTPRRGGLLTPQTERRFIDVPPRHAQSPPKSAKARMMAEDTDEFGWVDDSDENNELTELSSSQATESFMSQPNFHPDQPYKAPRTPTRTSPGKRKLFEAEYNDYNTSTSNSPIIPTPSFTHSSMSGRFPPSSAELCMTPTPTKYRDVLSSESRPDMSNLAKEANSILDKHNVVLPNKARDELVDLLNRHQMKLQGVNKGRDVTRQMLIRKEAELTKKDAEIKRLENSMTNLYAQREMDQSVIESISESMG